MDCASTVERKPTGGAAERGDVGPHLLPVLPLILHWSRALPHLFPSEKWSLHDFVRSVLQMKTRPLIFHLRMLLFVTFSTGGEKEGEEQVLKSAIHQVVC